MKLFASIVLGVTLPCALMAQTSTAEQFLANHSSQPGYSNAYITDYMFHLFLRMAEEETQQELGAITSGLSGINLLTVDTTLAPEKAATFYADASSTLTQSGYMTVKSLMLDGKELKLMIGGSNGEISELVMVGDYFMAALFGSMDLEQIVMLSENFDLAGTEPVPENE